MSGDTFPYTKENLAEIVVSYCCPIPLAQRIKIKSSRNAMDVFREIWQPNTIEYKEQFYVLCLSRNNCILGYFLHSTGGLSGTIVDVKQILGVAVKVNSASLILCHNHPSSNLQPSKADHDITRKIVNGAAFLDITLLDHLIITKHSYYSFADEGTLPHGNTSASQKVEEYVSSLE